MGAQGSHLNMSITFTGYTIESTHYLVDHLRLVEFPKNEWIRIVLTPKTTSSYVYVDKTVVTKWANAALKCTSGKFCIREVQNKDRAIVFFESASDAVTVKLMGYDDLSQFMNGE